MKDTGVYYTEKQLVESVVHILGEEASSHRRGETMWWGDALLYAAQYSFVNMRQEDQSSRMVRHAIGLLDDSLDIDPILFISE